jgi:hypothetical protein
MVIQGLQARFYLTASRSGELHGWPNPIVPRIAGRGPCPQRPTTALFFLGRGLDRGEHGPICDERFVGVDRDRLGDGACSHTSAGDKKALV